MAKNKERQLMPFYGASSGSVPLNRIPAPSGYDVLKEQVAYKGIEHIQPGHGLLSPFAAMWEGMYCGFVTIGQSLVINPFSSPPVPISRGAFLAQLSTGQPQAVYGTSPQAGIYTGVEDICTDW